MRATLLIASLPFAASALGFACGPASDPNDVGGPEYLVSENDPTTRPAESAAARETHQIKTAFVILLENQNWHEVKGSTSAPYINKVLLPASASAENYRNPAFLHPSEPNYIWMEAGSNLGILNNHEPDENHRTTKKHLTRLLQDANVPWKSYQQGISGTRCPLTAEADYEPKHNAMIFFTDMTDDNNIASKNCVDHVRPESELDVDLANDKVSGYVFITPDRCHNMHDGCVSGDAIKNGDDFLAAEIPRIQASNAYKNGGAIFITWDESEDGEYPIGMLVLSPLGRPGYRTATPFTHSSFLRTMQEIFAVGPFIRDAKNATPLAELFTAYP